MATLKQILEGTASKPSGAIESLKEEISKTSPLSLSQRTAIGFQNEKAQKSYLEKAFGKGNVSKDPNTNKWNIYDEKTDTVRPVDEKGFSGGDITESIGKGIVSAVTVPSAIAGKVGALGGPAGLAITSGLAGGISGATEAGRQTIGNLIAGESLKNVDMGEVGKEALYGAIAPGVGAGVGKITSKIGEKLASKAVNAGAGELAEQGSKLVKKTGNRIKIADVLKGNLEEDTLQDVANNAFVRKNIGTMTAKKLEGTTMKAAKSFQRTVDDFPKMREALYKGAGVKDTNLVPIDNAIKTIKTNIGDMIQGALSKEDDQAIANAMDTLGRVEKNVGASGKIEFGQLKKLTSKLYKMADQNVSESGALTPVGQLYDKMADSLTVAKHSIPELSDVSGKASQLFEAEKSMKMLGRLNKASGELRLYDRIANMTKKPALKAEFSRIKDILKSMPETKKYASILDRVNLAMVSNDIAKAKAVTPQGLGRIPGLKYLTNIPGLGDPESKMQLLARMSESGVIKPDMLNKTVTSSNIPILGGIEANLKARAALYGGKVPSMPNMIPQGVKDIAGKIGSGVQKIPLQVSPTQQIIKGGMRELGNKVSLPKFPSPKEQEDSIQMKLKDIHDGVKKTKEKDMIRIANMYDKYYKGLPKREMA